MKYQTVQRLARIGTFGIAAMLLTACGEREQSPAQANLSPEQQLIETGRRQARTCFGCHGPEGRSRVQSYPSLAGRSEEYLSQQLHAFRSGERDNPMMSSIARNLDDDAIKALSAYFASVPEGKE